jgi:hypothetical protein
MLLVLLAALALASSAAAESLWEMALPGEPMIPLDAHSLALGGATHARWDFKSGLPENPAQLAGLDGVTFSTVIQLRRAQRDIAGETWDETRQDFPGFQVSATLPGGLSLGAGYRAALRARGSFRETRYLEDFSYDLHYDQEGTLNRFPIDLALDLGSQLRLGAGLTLHRGKLEQEWIFDFPSDPFADSDFEYQDRRVRRQAEWRGTSPILGLQARPLDRLGASFYWEGEASLSGEERIETAGEDDVETRMLAGRMPARWAAGLAWRLRPQILLSAQWDHEDWSQYESPLPIEDLYDVDRYSLGLEWTRKPERSDRRRHYSYPLRLGLRLGNQPRPDPLGGGKVEERLIALGTGIAVQEGRGAVDLTLYWQQYNVDDGEGETRWGLALGLRTSEIWKKRSMPF